MRIFLCLITLGAACGCMAPGGAPQFAFTPLRQEPAPQAEAYSYYILATMHERAGRLEEAAAALEEVKARAPDALTPHVQLMQVYFRMRNLERATAVGEEAVEIERDDPSLWVLLGGIYLQQDRYEDAAAAFREVIRLDPDSPLGYEALIMAEESMNDLVATLEVYDRLLEMNPQSANLHFQRGLNLARIGDRETARAALEQALELNNALLRARYLLGVTCLELGDLDGAIHHLEALLRQSPDYQGAREHLAAALARSDRLARAIRMIEILFARGEAENRHHVQAMYLHILADRLRAAEEYMPPQGAPILSQILRIHIRRELGESYTRLVESLDQVTGDLDEEVRNYLNDLMYLYGETETAEFFAEFLAALRQEGRQSRIADTLLGRALMSLSRREEARDVLLETLQRHGGDRWVHYYLARIYLRKEDSENTERHIRAALELDPDNPEFMNFLGYFYAEEDRNLEEAKELLLRALEKDPDNAYYLDSLGWIYYRMGDADRAIEHIRNAIYHMSNDDAVLRDHLGDAYLLQGDVERAIAEWERAHRLDPDLNGVRDKIREHRELLSE